jgi:hypothetical protein
MRGKAGQASPEQIARYGHMAASLRKALADRGWTPLDLSKAIGTGDAGSNCYSWAAAKGGIGPKYRKIVAEILGIREEDLMNRDAPPKVPAKPAQAPAPVSAPVARPAPVRAPLLSFTIDHDGNGRIALDVTLPAADAARLLGLILERGAGQLHLTPPAPNGPDNQGETNDA